jgi:UV DNA damage endonuclease
MDLMIEAKDKEQAVFELMRNFKLPGYDSFNDILPYTRNDDNKAALAAINKKKHDADEPEPVLIDEDEVGMGGPEGRVYWPPGMEEWLRPKKREVKKKEPDTKSKEQIKKEATEAYEARKRAIKEEEDESDEHESDIDATPATKKAKAAMRKKVKADAQRVAMKEAGKVAKTAAKTAKGSAKKNIPVKRAPAAVPTPSDSESLADDLKSESDENGFDEDDDETLPVTPVPKRQITAGRRGAGRSAKGRVSYNEEGDEDL